VCRVAVDRIAARRLADEIPALRSPRARDRVRLLVIAAACAPWIAPGVSHWWVLLHERLMFLHEIPQRVLQDSMLEIMAARAGSGGRKAVRPPSRRKPSAVTFPTEGDDRAIRKHT